jgi:hypothetical protein
MKRLNDIKDKSPFKVPENYFEEVNRKIISATADHGQELKKVSIYSRFRTSMLIAASVAGLIVAGYTAIKIFTPDKTNSQVSEVLHEINPDEYINDIDISTLEESASSLNLSVEVPDVSKKDIINYLLLNNVDLNDIYEQL